MSGQMKKMQATSQKPQARRGFTLIEMLIVIAIMLLAMTLAVPAFRALSGSKSEGSAQNQLSALLGRVRTEAIGLQQVEGVLFYIDPATDRVTCAQVQIVDNLNGIQMLDLVPDRDTVSLPAGVRLQTLHDIAPPGSSSVGLTADLFQNDRYLGFNSIANNTTTNYSGNTTALGGVILFDGQGHLISNERYGFRFRHVPPPNPSPGDVLRKSAMGQLAFGTAATPIPNDWPTTTGGTNYLRSQSGFVLFDQETFQNAGGTDADNSPSASAEVNEEQWLDTNATPIFINRYNGTLIRAE